LDSKIIDVIEGIIPAIRKKGVPTPREKTATRRTIPMRDDSNPINVKKVPKTTKPQGAARIAKKIPIR
jgi:hypothetical protein